MTINISTLNIQFGLSENELKELIMTAVEQIKAKITEVAQVQQAAVVKIMEDVEYLKNQIATGNPISPEELGNIISQLDTLKFAIASVDPVPEFPPSANS